MDTQEKKLLKRKALGTFIAIVIGALLVFIVLQGLQQVAIQNKVRNESQQILKQVANTVETNHSEMEKLQATYHELNQSTASDLREVMDNGLYSSIKAADTKAKADYLSDIVDQSDIPYLFIMDSKGVVTAAPDSSVIDQNLVNLKLLTENNLATLVSTEGNNYVKEENKVGSFYFYSEPLASAKGKQFIVFGTDASIIDEQLASLEDISRVIKDISIGEEGFVFAVDSKSKEFIYYTDDNGELSGKSTADYGLEDDALADNYAGAQKINGTSYYCVSKSCGDYTIAVAASDLKKMYATNGNAWQWSVSSFIVIALLCIFYAVLVSKEMLIDEETEVKRRKLFRHKGEEYFYNVTVMKKILPVILLSVFIIFSISYYSCTMLGIRDAITLSDVNISELKSSIADADVSKETVKTYYENQYLEKARILAFLFEENPEVLNEGRNKEYYDFDDKNVRHTVQDDEGNHLMSASKSDILAKYCEANDIDSIFIYDDQGRTIATNTDKWYFILSYDEEDQSYPFRDVINQKTDRYIQEMGTDDLGEERQYIGAPLTYYTTKGSNGDTQYVSRYDYEQYKNGKWSGSPVTKHSSLLQIGIKPEFMEEILASTDYLNLLKKNPIKDVYLVLFDDTDDHNVIYSPAETSIGKTAEEIGFKSNAFFGDYIGFQRVNGKEYLIDIQYKSGYFIGSAILKANLFEERLATALITALLGLIFILFMTMLVTLSNKKEEEVYAKYTQKVDDLSDRIMFLIPTPAGSNSVTEKAMSRWDNRNIPWKERTPEQKLATAFFAVVALTIISIMLVAVLVGHGKIDDPILSYVITGNWDKGVNTFALTACGLIFVTAILAIQFLNIPIRLVTRIFGTKSETVGHLLTSVLKYFITIYSIFYCLYLLGIDSTSLLTSAGILSLIVGFGSQSLIKDIVAGIFIIFEGEFRVGDIVTINNYRGQVLDVGLRTTKLMAPDHNIKIINNSEINEVINMTRISSLCIIDVLVVFSTSAEEIERILRAELPLVKHRIPEILDGPYYDGIQSVSKDGIVLGISALCKEVNITVVRAQLYKEVLDILYRHDIHPPK